MDTETVQIKRATIADTLLLTELGRRTFYEAFAAMNSAEDMELYLAATFNPIAIEKEFDEAGSQFFIAYAKGEPIGYAKIRWKELPRSKETNAAEVQRLYVLQSHQNLQVGRRLMETCLKAVQEAGIKTIWLGVWEHNTGARRFYERFGFTKYSSHIFQLGNDAQTDHLMKLAIS